MEEVIKENRKSILISFIFTLLAVVCCWGFAYNIYDNFDILFPATFKISLLIILFMVILVAGGLFFFLISINNLIKLFFPTKLILTEDFLLVKSYNLIETYKWNEIKEIKYLNVSELVLSKFNLYFLILCICNPIITFFAVLQYIRLKLTIEIEDYDENISKTLVVHLKNGKQKYLPIDEGLCLSGFLGKQDEEMLLPKLVKFHNKYKNRK